MHQIISHLDELMQNLGENDTKVCCFENHDIAMDSVVFEDNGDPVAAARKIFVSNYQLYNCSYVSIIILVYYLESYSPTVCRTKENFTCLC